MIVCINAGILIGIGLGCYAFGLWLGYMNWRPKKGDKK